MSLSRTHVLAFRVALAVAVVSITHLATTERSYPVVEDVNDKLNHILAFGFLALAADFSFPKSAFGAAKASSLLAYGVLIEAVQYVLPFRSASLLDIAADGVGLAIYWAFYRRLAHLPLLRRRWEQI